MEKTNKQLAEDQNTTARQISKSRRRGWVTTKDGTRKSYKAPAPVFLIKKPTGGKPSGKTKG